MIESWLSFVGELGHNLVELVKGEALVCGGLLVNVATVHHLQKLVVINAVLHLLSNSLKLLEINHSALVLVVKSENSLQAVLSLSLTHAGCNNVDEFIESDGFVLVSQGVDEGQNEGISAIESQFLNNLVDFSGINGSTAVLIKDFEGLLELVPVFSIEAIFPSSRSGFGGLS